MFLYSDDFLLPISFRQLFSLPLNVVHALQLGVTVFTTLRSDASLCWRRTHLKRLHQHAHDLLGGMPPFREFAPTIDNAFDAHISPVCEGVVYSTRITLIPQDFNMGMMFIDTKKDPTRGSTTDVSRWGLLIELRDAHPLSAYPQTLEDLSRISIHLSRYQTLTPAFKKGSQFDALYLRQRIAHLGEEVAWVNDAGDITELTHANLFVHHKALGWMTPPNRQCLAGITRQQVIKAARTADVSISQEPINAVMLNQLDFAFATNSTQGWVRIDSFSREGECVELTPQSRTLDEATTLYSAWRNMVSTDNTSCYH